MSEIGILAYGSLVNDPGPEIAAKIVRRVPVTTPFPVEYARLSKTRGGGPTVAPHAIGGPVRAVVLVLSDAVPLGAAKDMLWRREVGRVGSGEPYPAKSTRDAVVIREERGFRGFEYVVYTDFHAEGKLPVPDAELLARAAVESRAKVPSGPNGIGYVVDLMSCGVETPLTRAYAQRVLQLNDEPRVAEALALLDKAPKSSLPRLVVAADWSTNPDKRWMVRAERDEGGTYSVFPPEPVGDLGSLIGRLRSQVAEPGSMLLGFDFPLGLPSVYAQKVGFSSFRDALRQLGTSPWDDFYTISNLPTLHQPFYPLPTQVPGTRRQTLAQGLGCDDLSAMLRACDRKTATRKKAECLFYTLGGAQVGAGAIVGWRDVIAPSLNTLNIWPFDGEISALLQQPGVVLAEIYPAEAYGHLGVRLGNGKGRGKTSRPARRDATRHWLADFETGQIRLTNAARSWIDWGFLAEDDFDAMAGLLSMLQVVTGQRPAMVPDDSKVRELEGWILGQAVPTCSSV